MTIITRKELKATSTEDLKNTLAQYEAEWKIKEAVRMEDGRDSDRVEELSANIIRLEVFIDEREEFQGLL